MLMIICIFIFLAIDIASKLLISNLMDIYDSIVVIRNFFNITYVRNTGAAWSIFADRTWMLIIISVLIILFIFFYIYKNKPKSKLEEVAYSLILGGSFGNLFDRILYGYVIDFLDFNIFGYDYPIFNLADTFIVLGVIIIVIHTWRCKDEN